MKGLIRRGIIVALVGVLTGCQAIQERTNKEAPNQVKQIEGRKEIKESGGGMDQKEEKQKESE